MCVSSGVLSTTVGLFYSRYSVLTTFVSEADKVHTNVRKKISQEISNVDNFCAVSHSGFKGKKKLQLDNLCVVSHSGCKAEKKPFSGNTQERVSFRSFVSDWPKFLIFHVSLQCLLIK